MFWGQSSCERAYALCSPYHPTLLRPRQQPKRPPSKWSNKAGTTRGVAVSAGIARFAPFRTGSCVSSHVLAHGRGTLRSLPSSGCLGSAPTEMRRSAASSSYFAFAASPSPAEARFERPGPGNKPRAGGLPPQLRASDREVAAHLSNPCAGLLARAMRCHGLGVHRRENTAAL